MSENTAIEWCDHTFNPWTGCTKVSPGCDHCYAEGWAKRSGIVQWGDAPRRRTSASNWREPLKWDRAAGAAGVRKKVFCASLADVFDNAAPQEWRDDLFALIERTPHLDWLLLTKRIGNVTIQVPRRWMQRGFPSNVWIGATMVNREEVERDRRKLLRIPASVHFVSMEPLLSGVDARPLFEPYCDGGSIPVDGGGATCPRCNGESRDGCAGVAWVIVGGESGPDARTFDVAWARSIVEQCRAAGVACFVKQLGARPVEHLTYPEANGYSESWEERSVELRDRKGGDPSEWPAGLRVREFPKLAA